MKRILECLCVVALILVGVGGCGGQGSELAPATETPPPPSQEDMQKLMKESMNQGGMTGELPVTPEADSAEPDSSN
jgi:predicted small lipoprotein YifL